ncbi:MAG TPA: phage tail assembly protein [Kofleriaceae bacterium]|jgi:hypothetical protein|nr:phage tail assembly protein [Kofleriaceae bacterium]
MNTEQDKAVITLKRPIDFAGERITSLELRRGRLGDLKGIGMGDIPPIDQLLLIVSRMCGKPVAALELIDVEDSGSVLEAALSFFARCLGGGKTP